MKIVVKLNLTNYFLTLAEYSY